MRCGPMGGMKTNTCKVTRATKEEKTNEVQEGSNEFCWGDSCKFNMWGITEAGLWQWVGFKQVEKEAEDMLGRG